LKKNVGIRGIELVSQERPMRVFSESSRRHVGVIPGVFSYVYKRGS